MPSGHAKATVGDTVLAETDTWEEVEGNVYFPPASVKTDYLSKTDHSTHCPWKGDASYYSIHADGRTLENAAWYYPQTKDKAEHIRDHVAFCKSVMLLLVLLAGSWPLSTQQAKEAGLEEDMTRPCQVGGKALKTG